MMRMTAGEDPIEEERPCTMRDNRGRILPELPIPAVASPDAYDQKLRLPSAEPLSNSRVRRYG